MNKNLDYVLPMDLGAFYTNVVYTINSIREKAEKHLAELKANKEEILGHVAMDIIGFDDFLITMYKHRTIEANSVYIYLDMENENYVVATKSQGKINIEATYELGQEKELLNCFIQTTQEKTLKLAS